MLPLGYIPFCGPARRKEMARVIDAEMAEARATEASGWDGCFITEHHQQEDGYLPNPLLTAGLIGMKTRRIKVGTCVCSPLLPSGSRRRGFRHCRSGHPGASGASIGVGYRQPDFDTFEVPINTALAARKRRSQFCRRSWQGGRFSFEGGHFKLENVLVTPPPLSARAVRRSGWPRWTPPGLRRAADRRRIDRHPVQSLPRDQGLR